MPPVKLLMVVRVGASFTAVMVIVLVPVPVCKLLDAPLALRSVTL